MSLEQKECKKITSSNEKGIDKFKVDALFAFFIDKKKKRDGPGREKEGRSWKRKRGTVLKREKNIKKINPLNELTFKRVPRENLD